MWREEFEVVGVERWRRLGGERVLGCVFFGCRVRERMRRAEDVRLIGVGVLWEDVWSLRVLRES